MCKHHRSTETLFRGTFLSLHSCGELHVFILLTCTALAATKALKSSCEFVPKWLLYQLECLYSVCDWQASHQEFWTEGQHFPNQAPQPHCTTTIHTLLALKPTQTVSNELLAISLVVTEPLTIISKSTVRVLSMPCSILHTDIITMYHFLHRVGAKCYDF